VDLKGVGALERPERITLLAAPQAFFGLSLNGWVLRSVVILLAVSAVVTVVQRVRAVARATQSGTP
jgi:CDP-diacylglycerol--glycerol-3-phosphate 3-phosphatidyltransferase